MTQKSKYLKEFAKHKYWKYQFVDTNYSDQVQIILVQFTRNIEYEDIPKTELIELQVKESIEITDTETVVEPGVDASIYIMFPLGKKDFLTKVSKEYYMFFRNLSK